WKLILEAVSVALAIGSPFCCRGGSSESPSWPAIARSGCYFRSDVASFAYRRNHVLGCASGTPTREHNRGRLVGGAKLCAGYNRVGVSRTFFAEPLLAFLTAGSLYLVLGGTVREVIGAGVFVGLAVLAKPAGVIVG